MAAAFLLAGFNAEAFQAGPAHLRAATAIVVATSTQLTALSSMNALAELAVSTTATLNPGSPLLTATTQISVSSLEARLQLKADFQAASAIAVTTTGAALTLPVPLRGGTATAFPPWAFNSAAFEPRLQSLMRVTVTSALTAPINLRSTTALGITVTARLTSLPATFASTPQIHVSTIANLAIVGPTATTVQITIGGGAAEDLVRMGSLQISDVLNDAPNSLTFLLNGSPPPVGAEVRVGLANLTASNLVFGGTVQQVEQAYEGGTPLNRVWRITCADYEYLLNRRRIWRTYENVSATTVALDILARDTSGFTGLHVVNGLPNISLTLTGQMPGEAFNQIATLIGGYRYVDYARDLHLYVNETSETPDPIDGMLPTSHQNDPPVTLITDTSQVRTRELVQGASVRAEVATGFPLAAAATLPIDDASPFSAGQVLLSTGEIASYTGTAPGGLTATVQGNVTPPSSSGTPSLEPGVAGPLSGTYRWAATFGTGSGETAIGVATGLLVAPEVATPTHGPGIGATGTVGPLVGARDYRIAYLTTLGETLPGPITSRTATALTAGQTQTQAGGAGISRLRPGVYKWATTYVTAYGETAGGPEVSATLTDPAVPGPPTVTASAAPGVLAVGAEYRYRTTFVTQDGETAPGVIASFTPGALSGPSLSNANAAKFGGLYGGPYSYGASIVTALGESGLVTLGIGSGFATTGPAVAPTWTGGQDTAGRIEPGLTYFWAASWYHDVYGESPLGPAFSQSVSPGSVPIRMLMTVPSVPSGADGIRIYRGITNGPFLLDAEFRVATGIPATYWDTLSHAELGSQYPIQTLRAGVQMNVTIGASSESGVIARRVYRTKANGSEYFFVGEIQHNGAVVFTDALPDAQLTIRHPASITTGRQAALSLINTGPPGTIGRRIYRTRANGSEYYLVGELKDNVTATWTDNTPDTALTIVMPATNTAGAQHLTSWLPAIVLPTGPTGVITRRLYRTRANGSVFFLVTEIRDNTTITYEDNTPDDALSPDTMPGISTGGGDTHALSSIPIGPPGTLARLIYRTKAGGSEFFLVGRISDNTTGSFTDAVADADLGTGVALVNTAGASVVRLNDLPLGPAGVTQRIIYRTKAGGTDFFYVGTVADNMTRTFLDDRPDSALGRSPQATSTIGALVGESSLVLDTVTGFPSSGWISVSNDLIRYTGISGTTLTGIPTSGSGAIQGAIRGGSTVTTVPMLTGVTGWTTELTTGDTVSIWVVLNDLAAQAARAAAEGGDGIHEHLIVDTALDSVAAATARGLAELARFKDPQVTVTYTTRDPKTRSGKTVVVSLPPPLSISATLKILDVKIDQIDIAPRLYPRYTVKASNARFSLEDLLRRVVMQ